MAPLVRTRRCCGGRAAQRRSVGCGQARGGGQQQARGGQRRRLDRRQAPVAAAPRQGGQGHRGRAVAVGVDGCFQLQSLWSLTAHPTARSGWGDPPTRPPSHHSYEPSTTAGRRGARRVAPPTKACRPVTLPARGLRQPLSLRAPHHPEYAFRPPRRRRPSGWRPRRRASLPGGDTHAGGVLRVRAPTNATARMGWHCQKYRHAERESLPFTPRSGAPPRTGVSPVLDEFGVAEVPVSRVYCPNLDLPTGSVSKITSSRSEIQKDIQVHFD